VEVRALVEVDGRLIVDSSRPVADQSAYTVIVARQINLYEGPNLHLRPAGR
jgi:hypothetical protein